MKFFLSMMCSFFVANIAHAKFDRVSYKPAQNILEKNGVEDACTEMSFNNLFKYVSELETENNQEEMSEEYDKKEKRKNYSKFYSTAMEHLLFTKNLTCSDYLKVESFNLARSIIYAIFTDKFPISQMSIKDWVGMIGNGVITIPYKSPKDRLKKLTIEQAQSEASNLVNPLTKKVYTPKELTNLNYIQVAKLDIGKNHQMWRNQEDLEKTEWTKEGAWGKLENMMNAKATKKFSKRCKDLCTSLENKYDLKIAKKILIFEKVKTSATSPKIEGKDLYGFNWKIKWGVEAFVESVVGRLYMKLGGKFSEITYTNTHGSSDLLLILGSMGEKSSCHNINNYEWFLYCMKTSIYEFNPSPYIAQTGIITGENLDSIFNGATSIIKDPKIRAKYIGRTWVTFKESLVEFNAENVLPKVGSGPENRLGFENDRVLRGLSLLASWVGNDDAKEDNSRSVLTEEDGKDVFVHYWHDLGSALGSTIYPGKINSLKTNTDFMYTATSLYKNSPKLLIPYEFLGHTWIVVPRLHLYKPDSWNKVTYSDGLWMAMKIASLQESDIKEAVAASKLPQFVQDALVFKLMDRRIRMAKIFGITFPGVQDSYPLTIKYNLTKKEVRQAIAKYFDINFDRMEFEINKNKLLKGKKEYFDTVVKDGEIVSCSKSLLVNIVEKAWFPSGLERRRSRLNYKDQMPDCIFNP